MSAATDLQLVVGLGNPGPQYEQTRHNAGFWFVEELARDYGGRFRTEAKFNAELCTITVDGQRIWLLKPMTYMNHSGQSVGRFAAFYKIPLPAILIAHDDLDLPPGAVRLKKAGGHGGHNGLRDSIRHLGGNDFLRLRLGIGHPGSSRQVVDYVLSRAPQDEQRLIEDGLLAAAQQFPRIAAGEIEKVMQALHSRPRIETTSSTEAPKPPA